MMRVALQIFELLRFKHGFSYGSGACTLHNAKFSFLRHIHMCRKSLGVDPENSFLEGVYTPRVRI